MNKPCPACGAAMTLGELGLGQTALGFLAAGAALPHLFFTPQKGDRVSVLAWSEVQPPAWRCGKCGTVVFPGRPDADTE